MAARPAVRFLFTFSGGIGHFLPCVPFARVLRDRGHSASFGCQDSMVPIVRSQGWRALASGGATLLTAGQRRPLVPVDRAREAAVVGRFFADRVARERARRLVQIIESERPQVVVRDEMDFGAAVAAEACGIPHATVIVIAAGGFYGPREIAEPLAALRSQHGLVDDGLEMLHRHLTLAPVPPSFRDPHDPLPAVVRHTQPAVLDTAAPDRSDGRPPPHRPRIYFTLGTVFHQESGDLFARVLAGLSALEGEIVVSVSNEIDPAELGPQPPHVRIERFIDPQRMLPSCDLVVSHGGSGTVIGALAFGVPQLLLPLGADQPLNGDRCTQLGVARVLDPLGATPAEIRDAAAGVMGDPAYRVSAARIRDEIWTLPDSASAADLLENLGAAGRR